MEVKKKKPRVYNLNTTNKFRFSPKERKIIFGIIKNKNPSELNFYTLVRFYKKICLIKDENIKNMCYDYYNYFFEIIPPRPQITRPKFKVPKIEIRKFKSETVKPKANKLHLFGEISPNKI